MPQTCAASFTEALLRVGARRGLCALALLLGGCGRQDGVVGFEPGAVAAGGSAGAGDAAGAAGSETQTPTFHTDFDAKGGDWTTANHLDGSSTEFGVPIMGANDPSTAALTFPGDPNAAPADNVGTSLVTEIASAQRFGFGTFRTRLAFGTCQPNEDVVNAALGYFSDGSDTNGNGITDDLEINIQVLCGTPQYVFLTVFTDYQIDAQGNEQFRKLSRVLDFSSGAIYDSPSASQEGFVKTSTDVSWVHPELFAAGAFYEVGFEWHAKSLRFFMQIEGTEQTLWTLSNPASIPQQPLSFVYNLWHPASHWYPATGKAAFPAQPVTLHVDWFDYYAE